MQPVKVDGRPAQLPSSTSRNSTSAQRIPSHRPTFDPYGSTDPPSLPSPGVKALGGSNADVVNNRAAIRMANISAAESLKADLAAKIPLGRKTVLRTNTQRVLSGFLPTSELLVPTQSIDSDAATSTRIPQPATTPPSLADPVLEGPTPQDAPSAQEYPSLAAPPTPSGIQATAYADQAGDSDDMDTSSENDTAMPPRGPKRKAHALEEPADDTETDCTRDQDQVDLVALTRGVNPDGTTVQSDTVR